MLYEDVRLLSVAFGLIFFIATFALVVVYALWPRNREKFDDAAQIPLRED